MAFARKQFEKEVCKIIDSVCDTYKSKLFLEYTLLNQGGNELSFVELVDKVDTDARAQCKLAVSVKGRV